MITEAVKIIKQKSLFCESVNRMSPDWIPIVEEWSFRIVDRWSPSTASINGLISDPNYTQLENSRYTMYFRNSRDSPAINISIVFSVLIGMFSASIWTKFPSTSADAPRIINERLRVDVTSATSMNQRIETKLTFGRILLSIGCWMNSDWEGELFEESGWNQKCCGVFRRFLRLINNIFIPLTEEIE